MAEGILRQSYDSTGTKVFPLTVIDGILRKTDVNVMDASNRGAYAIIDSMLHHDVDFENQKLTELYVYERTWNTDSSEYNADASIVLSVDKDGLEVKSGKYTKLSGEVSAYSTVNEGGDVLFGKYSTDQTLFTKYGRNTVVDESNYSYGKIELYRKNEELYFSIGDDEIKYGNINGQGTVTDGLSVKYGQIKYTGSITSNGNIVIGGDASINKTLKVGQDTSLYGNLYVAKAIYAPNGDDNRKHHLMTSGNELNLAGNNSNTHDILFNHRSGQYVDFIKMMRGTTKDVNEGGLTTVVAKNLQLGGNYSYYTDTSLVLTTNGTGKPSIVFERGTSGDTYTDFRIIDDAGQLKFQYKYGTGDVSVYGDKSTSLIIDSDNGGVVRPGNTSPGVDFGTYGLPWKAGYFRDAIYAGTSAFHDGYYTKLDWNSISAWKSDGKSDLLIQHNGGNTDVRGLMITRNVEPNSGSTYNIGTSDKRYLKGYFSSLDVSDPWSAPSISGEPHTIDAGMDPFIGFNRGTFFNPDNISIGYINKSNSWSWKMYTYDSGKLFNLVSKWDQFYLSSNTGNSSGTVVGATTDTLLVRFTAPDDGYPYMDLKRIAINVTTLSWNLKVTVSTLTDLDYKAHKDNDPQYYVDRGTYTLQGWSGWNSIPLDISFGSSHIRCILLKFFVGNKSVPSSYNTRPYINCIHLLGTSIWNSGGYWMNLSGHLYDWDKDQHAYFPNIVSATGGFQTEKDLNFKRSGMSDGYVNSSSTANILRIGKEAKSTTNVAVQLLAAGTPSGGYSNAKAALEVQGGSDNVVSIKPELRVTGNITATGNVTANGSIYATNVDLTGSLALKDHFILNRVSGRSWHMMNIAGDDGQYGTTNSHLAIKGKILSLFDSNGNDSGAINSRSSLKVYGDIFGSICIDNWTCGGYYKNYHTPGSQEKGVDWCATLVRSARLQGRANGDHPGWSISSDVPEGTLFVVTGGGNYFSVGNGWKSLGRGLFMALKDDNNKLNLFKIAPTDQGFVG